MERFKKYRMHLGVAIVLIVIAAPVLLVLRFRQNDTRAFSDFTSSYIRFDTAISAVSGSRDDPADLEHQADTALAELTAAANTFRLSSLVENDATLMAQARQIADVSSKEREALRAYKQAVLSKSPAGNALGKQFIDLAGRRKAAYAVFQELAGLKG